MAWQLMAAELAALAVEILVSILISVKPQPLAFHSARVSHSFEKHMQLQQPQPGEEHVAAANTYVSIGKVPTAAGPGNMHSLHDPDAS